MGNKFPCVFLVKHLTTKQSQILREHEPGSINSTKWWGAQNIKFSLGEFSYLQRYQVHHWITPPPLEHYFLQREIVKHWGDRLSHSQSHLLGLGWTLKDWEEHWEATGKTQNIPTTYPSSQKLHKVPQTFTDCLLYCKHRNSLRYAFTENFVKSAKKPGNIY